MVGRLVHGRCRSIANRISRVDPMREWWPNPSHFSVTGQGGLSGDGETPCGNSADYALSAGYGAGIRAAPYGIAGNATNLRAAPRPLPRGAVGQPRCPGQSLGDRNNRARIGSDRVRRPDI
jgi:hypothetical protein